METGIKSIFWNIYITSYYFLFRENKVFEWWNGRIFLQLNSFCSQPLFSWQDLFLIIKDMPSFMPVYVMQKYTLTPD